MLNHVIFHVITIEFSHVVQLNVNLIKHTCSETQHDTFCILHACAQKIDDI